MGRKKIEVNPVKLYDLISQGKTQREIAQELGISHVTLAKRIAELQANKGILLNYRSIQTLQLTALQFRILEAVTSEKIKEASLAELIKAFALLKKVEQGIKLKQSKISGLLAYLESIEEGPEL